MDLEFLSRIRRTSLMATAAGSLFAAVYVSYATGMGFAAGALWSLANLRLLEVIVTCLTGGAKAGRNAAMAGVANVVLMVLGGFMLVKLPVLALAAGFTLPFAIILLKVVSSTLLESSLWAKITRSPWRATALVAALAAVAWFTVVPLTRAQGGHDAGHAQAEPAAPAAEHAAPETRAADIDRQVHEQEAARKHAAEREHAAGGHETAGHEAGPKEFDNLVTVIAKAMKLPIAQDHKALGNLDSVIFAIFVGLVLCVVAAMAARDKSLVPGPFRNAVEALFEPVYNGVVDILGPKYGPRYVPFLGSLFVYILCMNLFGTIPLMKAPTSNLNVTLALAVTVFVYVQYTAITELGFIGWLDHLAGSPRSPIEWGLVPLAFPIHLIGELAKPVSLSCRLFGNIFGEDMLLVGFAGLGITLMSTLGLGALPFGVPFHFVFLFLALLTSVVQALVFAMLSTIYFLLMLPHDHDASHGHDHAHEAEAHHPAH